MRKHHVPIRSCVGCGQRGPQREMLRFTASTGGQLMLMERGSGRGAYLHANPQCWELFARRKGLVRSLRRSIDRTTRQTLVQMLLRTAKKELTTDELRATQRHAGSDDK